MSFMIRVTLETKVEASINPSKRATTLIRFSRNTMIAADRNGGGERRVGLWDKITKKVKREKLEEWTNEEESRKENMDHGQKGGTIKVPGTCEEKDEG